MLILIIDRCLSYVDYEVFCHEFRTVSKVTSESFLPFSGLVSSLNFTYQESSDPGLPCFGFFPEFHTLRKVVSWFYLFYLLSETGEEREN